MKAEEIRKASRPKVKLIENVPGWDVPVFIRKLSAIDAKDTKEEFSRKNWAENKTFGQLIDLWLCHLIANCLVDEEGTKIYTPEEVMEFDQIPYEFLCIEVAEYNNVSSLNYKKAREKLGKALASGKISS